MTSVQRQAAHSGVCPHETLCGLFRIRRHACFCSTTPCGPRLLPLYKVVQRAGLSRFAADSACLDSGFCRDTFVVGAGYSCGSQTINETSAIQSCLVRSKPVCQTPPAAAWESFCKTAGYPIRQPARHACSLHQNVHASQTGVLRCSSPPQTGFTYGLFNASGCIQHQKF